MLTAKNKMKKENQHHFGYKWSHFAWDHKSSSHKIQILDGTLYRKSQSSYSDAIALGNKPFEITKSSDGG